MTNKDPKPPKAAEWFLKRKTRWDDEYGSAGDFDEEFFELAAEKGAFHAKCWYWKHLLLSLPASMMNSIVWSIAMLKNYFKIGLRNIYKQKFNSLINITGLAAGLAIFMLAVILTDYNLNFDTFHKNADRIYGVVNEFSSNTSAARHSAIIPAPLMPAMQSEFPEIEESTRLFDLGRTVITLKDQNFYEWSVYFTDPNFLTFFTFEMIRGNPETVLSEPYSVVLSEKTALKYFGDEDPLGKTFTLGKNAEVTVTGIIEDPPQNSSILYSMLVSIETAGALEHDPDDWTDNKLTAFLRIKEGTASRTLEEKFPGFMDKYMGSVIDKPDRMYLMPLLDFHMRSEGVSSYLYYIEPVNFYLITIISLLLLLVVCINFMNLATAKYLTRANEVGMRKVVGAKRHQLIKQFLGESVLISLLAFPLAVVLYEYINPLFLRAVADEATTDVSLWNHPAYLLYTLLIVVFVGILSGSYPAFFLSRFRPVQVLKGKFISGKKGTLARKVLVVMQTGLALIFIVATLVFKNQAEKLAEVDLGYEKEKVMFLALNSTARSQMELLKEEFSKHSDVVSVAAAASLPAAWNTQGSVLPEGFSEDEKWTMNVYDVDYGFTEILRVDIIRGRSLSLENTDEGNYIINEMAARQLNWDDPIGKELTIGGKKGQVIGLTEDYHFKGLHQNTSPSVLRINPENLHILLIKYSSEDIVEDLKEHLGEVWKVYVDDQPFECFSMDKYVIESYGGIKRFAKMTSYISLIAIFFTCMGLIGLVSYSMERKTKEVGIRKILGASPTIIVKTLSSEFLKLIMLSNIAALPLAYFLCGWLMQIAVVNAEFRTDIDITAFIISALITFLATAVAITSQTLKASRANPVNSLRYE